MKDLVKFYRKMLGFKDCYARIVQCTELTNNEIYIRKDMHKPSFLWDVKPSKEQIKVQRPKNGNKIDVPVWFGDQTITRPRILVVGIAPHGGYENCDIEHVGEKVFGAIFGAERWNDKNNSSPKSPKSYYKAFQPLLAKANDGKLFVIFTDLIKAVSAESRPSKMTLAQFRKMANEARNKAKFFEEIKEIKPTHIIALGYWVCCELNKWHVQGVMYVRHPAHGGTTDANKQISQILKSIFTNNKSRRAK